MPDDVIKRCVGDKSTELSRHPPDINFGWDKESAVSQLADEMTHVAALQDRLFAESAVAMLVVIQAIDAGGKDGAIRSVLTGVNPAGVRVNAFGVPSEEERSHDYLWRIHADCPPKGTIGILNRSHYEDVLVVRVKGFAPEKVWKRRYKHIGDFEQMLTDEGTHVVKLFLNISKEEQRLRLQDRIDDPNERWKFRLGDLDDRALWDDYQDAFQDAIRKTSTDHAPWYVVPGDRKWVRNLVIAKILRHHLELIDPQYPPAEEGVEGVVVT
jgi:PPK2 family polyphosphate:nucleotide phosphotransferase